jgi:plastocyanin
MISSCEQLRYIWRHLVAAGAERAWRWRAVIVLTMAACTGSPPTEAPAEPINDLLARITRPGDGGSVHLVRIVQHGDRYEFDPSRTSIASGDVVRFVMVGTQPESVAFDPVQATPEAGEFIRANSLHLGVLLVEPGQAYDVAFREAPPGAYPFHSIGNADRGMRGIVQVGE